MNDPRVTRDRQLVASANLDRAGDLALFASAAKMVTTVAVVSYPAGANVYFGVVENMLTGSEAEGAAPTITPIGATIYAYNVGTVNPPLGTDLVIHSTGGRWTFRYDG